MSKKEERLIRLIKNAQEEFGDEYFIAAVPGFMSKKFIAYCAMKEDVLLILEYINILRKKPNFILESSLSYSLISLYGKCFTDASKSSFPKLESNIFNGNDVLKETHEYLMKLRHQFIAHRGDTESEIGISYMIIPKKNQELKTQIRFRQVKQKSFNDEDLNRFENQMDFLHSFLLEKIQKTGQKLHDKYLDIFSPEEIVKMVFNEAK
ncbi:hypothetical protein [Paenimyroides ceti]